VIKKFLPQCNPADLVFRMLLPIMKSKVNDTQFATRFDFSRLPKIMERLFHYQIFFSISLKVGLAVVSVCL